MKFRRIMIQLCRCHDAAPVVVGYGVILMFVCATSLATALDASKSVLETSFMGIGWPAVDGFIC